MGPDSLFLDEPSMANAVERMLLAGQQLVVDRLDLMLLGCSSAFAPSERPYWRGRMSDENRRATAERSSKVSNEPVFTGLQLQAFAEDHPLALRRFCRRRWLRRRPRRL